MLQGVDVLKFVHQQVAEAGLPAHVQRQHFGQHVVQIPCAQPVHPLVVGFPQAAREARGFHAVLLLRQKPQHFGGRGLLAPLFQQLRHQGKGLLPAEQRLFLQQIQSNGMECAHSDGSCRVPQTFLQSGAHFLRRLMGKGNGGDLLRRHLPPFHQIGDAFHQRAGLAGSGAGHHGNDFVLRLDGFLLLRVHPQGQLLHRFFRLRFGGVCFYRLLFRPGRGKARQLQQGSLAFQQFQLVGFKHGDHAVFAVIARLLVNLSRAQTAQGFGYAVPHVPLHHVQRQLPQDRKLRAVASEHFQIGSLYPLAGRAGLHAVGQQLRQRHQTFEGTGKRPRLPTVGQLVHPVQHAYGQLSAADRASAIQGVSFLRLQTAAAGSVAVQMVLALLREKFDRPLKALAGFQRVFQLPIGRAAGKQIGLPPQLLRRVRVGIGHQQIGVQLGHPPVHGRVGRKPRLQRMNAAGHIAVAFLQRGKLGKFPEHGKMRRPDMSWNKDRVRAGVHGHLQKVPAVHAQNGPAVAVQVAYGFQPVGQFLRLVQPGQQDDVMHLPGLPVLLVDGADLPGYHKADGFAAAGYAGRQGELLPQCIYAVSGRLQHFPKL